MAFLAFHPSLGYIFVTIRAWNIQNMRLKLHFIISRTKRVLVLPTLRKNFLQKFEFLKSFLSKLGLKITVSKMFIYKELSHTKIYHFRVNLSGHNLYLPFQSRKHEKIKGIFRQFLCISSEVFITIMDFSLSHQVPI